MVRLSNKSFNLSAMEPPINPKTISYEINLLKKMNIKIIKKKNSLIVKNKDKIKNINIITKPYPGFPTDLQAQLMVLLTPAYGVSKIKENIFENRFMHVPELKRMGAHIKIKDKTAIIKGVCPLAFCTVVFAPRSKSIRVVSICFSCIAVLFSASLRVLLFFSSSKFKELIVS